MRLSGIPACPIPALLRVVERFARQWPMLLHESLPTPYATLDGFVPSAVIGIRLTMLIASSRRVESDVHPLPVFSQGIPRVAIAPLVSGCLGGLVRADRIAC